jgi:hypothetical protein
LGLIENPDNNVEDPVQHQLTCPLIERQSA